MSKKTSPPINWHRIFGLLVSDLFYGSPYEVDIEKDLSLKQQYLDLVIVRKSHTGSLTTLPDGLEPLAEHNLISYKSHHESMNAWAIKELISYYVNYRKQVRQERGHLLPEKEIRLFAVATKYPQKLAQQLPLAATDYQGVYDLTYGTEAIRLIVLSQISDQPHNDLWQLFSANAAKIDRAWHHYRPHQSDVSSVIYQLLKAYQQEFYPMSYTLEEFNKEFVKNHLHLIPAEEVLKQYSADEVLKRYSPDEVLKRYSPDERLKDLSPDEILRSLPQSVLDLLRGKIR